MLPKSSSGLRRLPAFGRKARFESPDGSGEHPRRGAALAQSVDIRLILDVVPRKRRIRYDNHSHVFRQGDFADCIYVIERGRVKLSRVRRNGREVILAVLSAGDFLGELCLMGTAVRTATAVSLGHSQLLQIDKQTILELLRNDRQFAEHFLAYSLVRLTRFEDELESQLSNSAEVRLARCLLLLTHAEPDGESAGCISHLDHGTLAQMVGTTQGRISHFMRSFQERGLIQYTRKRIVVRPGLFQVLLGEDAVRDS